MSARPNEPEQNTTQDERAPTHYNEFIHLGSCITYYRTGGGHVIPDCYDPQAANRES